jgi:hypothetical protein
VLYTSLLTGEVKAFRYDDETGETSEGSGSWTARPSKRAARTLSMEADGSTLWMGGKGGGLLYVFPGRDDEADESQADLSSRIDPGTGVIKKEYNPAHE